MYKKVHFLAHPVVTGWRSGRRPVTRCHHGKSLKEATNNFIYHMKWKKKTYS